jgi:hypothetical protein
MINNVPLNKYDQKMDYVVTNEYFIK